MAKHPRHIPRAPQEAPGGSDLEWLALRAGGLGVSPPCDPRAREEQLAGQRVALEALCARFRDELVRRGVALDSTLVRVTFGTRPRFAAAWTVSAARLAITFVAPAATQREQRRRALRSETIRAAGWQHVAVSTDAFIEPAELREVLRRIAAAAAGGT